MQKQTTRLAFIFTGSQTLESVLLSEYLCV
jgi:hypothetical protein